MGCRKSKFLLSEEEKLVTNVEDLLGIYNVDSQKGIFELKTYSHHHKLSESQLRQALGKFDLELLDNYKTIGSPEFKFYEKFKRGRRFNERDFVMLMIILGCGNNVDKARMIFTEWDVDINKKIYKKDIGEIIASLNKIFVEAFVDLTIALEADEANRELLESYRSALNSGVQGGKKALTAIFFSALGVVEVSEADFIVLLGMKNPELLTSYGYRKFIAKFQARVKSSLRQKILEVLAKLGVAASASEIGKAIRASNFVATSRQITAEIKRMLQDKVITHTKGRYSLTTVENTSKATTKPNQRKSAAKRSSRKSLPNQRPVKSTYKIKTKKRPVTAPRKSDVKKTSVKHVAHRRTHNTKI